MAVVSPGARLGVKVEAQFLFDALLVLAGLLIIAIMVAWKAYGARIAELYDPQDASAPRQKSMSSLNIGESTAEWSRTWHARRRGGETRNVPPNMCVDRVGPLPIRRFDAPDPIPKKTR